MKKNGKQVLISPHLIPKLENVQDKPKIPRPPLD